jgi:hypothetical protein
MYDDKVDLPDYAQQPLQNWPSPESLADAPDQEQAIQNVAPQQVQTAYYQTQVAPQRMQTAYEAAPQGMQTAYQAAPQLIQSAYQAQAVQQQMQREYQAQAVPQRRLTAYQAQAVAQPPRQQSSFLHTSSQSESADAIRKLTGVVQQQAQALRALEAEQHKLQQVETEFVERSLAVIQSLTGVPKCKKEKITDKASCDKACEKDKQPYTGGAWTAEEGEGLFASFYKAYRCDCKNDKSKTPDKKDLTTLCTDSGAKIATPLLGIFSIAMVMVHM